LKEITIKETCKILNISIPRVYQLAKEGKLTRYKKMGKSIFDKKEVLELLKPKAVK